MLVLAFQRPQRGHGDLRAALAPLLSPWPVACALRWHQCGVGVGSHPSCRSQRSHSASILPILASGQKNFGLPRSHSDSDDSATIPMSIETPAVIAISSTLLTFAMANPYLFSLVCVICFLACLAKKPAPKRAVCLMGVQSRVGSLFLMWRSEPLMTDQQTYRILRIE